MRKTYILFLLVGVFCLISCSSRVKEPIKTTHQQKIALCGQIIKYQIEKVTSNGQELKVSIEFTINPIEKIISMNSDDQQFGKETKEFIMESAECNFNSDLTSGTATYKGYTKESDGSTAKSTMMVIVKDGNIIISPPDEENTSNFKMMVSKWEIVKQ